MADRYRNRRSRRPRDDYFQDRQAEQFSADRDWQSGSDYDQPGAQMGEGYWNQNQGDYQSDNSFEQGYDRNERFARRGSGYSRSEEGYPSTDRYNYGPSRVASRQGRGFRSFTSEDQGGSDFVAGGWRDYGSGFGGRSAQYSSGYYDRAPNRGYSDRHHDRGFFDRASDELASWFGDEDAARRREMDHSGRGPREYVRSDDRILEDACDNLTDDWGIDARDITVSVESGEVTLNGTVDSRRAKRRAEDCVDCISGVRHVQNNLRVNRMTGDDLDTDRAAGERTTGSLT